MILSRNFIKDYIDLDDKLPITQIAEDMTRVGNEYDSAEKLINATNLVIGKVIECSNHPDSDHLHICKVDIGKSILDIVCGAPNVRKGIKVIVALVGAKLPDGEIKKSVIRGATSNGMLCSIKELGLDNKFLTEKDIEGIAELGDDAKLGEDPIKYLGLDDEVIDFELTANRGDELSMLGLAYELGAIYNKKVKLPNIKYKEVKDNIKDCFNIDIQTKNCSMFLARKVKNVTIKESPDFIKNRLIACGIRPINNVVDISNYVMLETGQPLHFYDADRLGNTLIVRMAKEKEKLVTLDNEERVLSGNDIVIADNKEAVGLAGVMGGLTTEVESDTKDIIIESAIFDSIKVRITSKKILRSEASNRFEKGLDPNRTYLAMERACTLLSMYADGVVLSGMIEYNKTNAKEKTIKITTEDINNVLGTDIKTKEIKDIFTRLGFSTKAVKNNMEVTVPTRRLDISIKEDLIEEVGRIYGINNIEGRLPNLPIKRGTYNKKTRSIRNKLVDLGLNEVLTQIFITEADGHKYTNDDFEIVKLLDPLSIEKNSLRYTLIPSLMKVYNYNRDRNINDIRIFEIAKGFYLKDKKYGEDEKLCLLLAGDYYQELGHNRKIDFYIIKGIVEELLIYLGYENRYSLVEGKYPKEFHPYQSAYINLNGEDIGIIGKLHPNVVKDDVYVAEINLSKLSKYKVSKIKYREINKYPSIKKDLAFIVDKDIPAEDISKTIKKAGGKNLTNIEIFDLYIGDKIDSNKKSIAFSLTFEDTKKTLTDEEVMDIFNKIIKDVEKKHKAILRDK
ncbi:MAG: phenylalanine--tRNA ligase subunit beta [Bacilli bacterium]|nr:phenylalanine--tRNA ligase subunit beta [Bacilli bacterium]